MTEDVYFKKTVRFKHDRQLLEFRVSQELFSSHEVDVGTQRLLRTLTYPDVGPFHKVLDLGCGYGPIGLSLLAADRDRLVHLVDRDALALSYARQNAALNGLRGAEVYGSLGYDDVSEAGFDLIVSNLPAKAGPPVLSYLLREARHHLAAGGRVAVVVVEALDPAVTEVLEDPGVGLLLRKDWPGHAVLHYRFSARPQEMARPGESALERGVYERASTTFSFRGLSFPMRTAYNLSEFDTLSHQSELLVKALQQMEGAAVGRVLLFNPGQGHVAVALWQLLRPAEILLVDRDLLGLRCARRNLLLNGCPEERVALSHQVGIAAEEGAPDGGPADLIVGVLREEEGQKAVALAARQAAERLAPGGTILVAASSTAATRLAGALQPESLLRIRKRERSKGKSLLVLQRRSSLAYPNRR